MAESYEMDLLVKNVLEELKKRLAQESITKQREKSAAIPPAKRALVIGELSSDERLLLSNDYELLTVKNSLGQSQDQYGSSTEEDLCQSCQIFIAATLSVSALAQAAAGCPVSSDARALVSALLLGKQVYLLENGIEYRRYRPTAHKTLYSLYQRYEDMLLNAGARIVPDLTCLRDVLNCPFSEDASHTWVDFTARRIVTESDILKVKKSSGLLLGASTILTPLARDYIESHRLPIRRQ